MYFFYPVLKNLSSTPFVILWKDKNEQAELR